MAATLLKAADMRFGCVLPILLISSSLAWAQDDATPDSGKGPLILNVSPNSGPTTLYLGPNSRRVIIHAAPNLPPLNIDHFLRHRREGDPTPAAINSRQPLLSTEMDIAIPFRNGATDAEMTKAMALSMRNLNDAMSRQCETLVASFKGGCRVVGFNLDATLLRDPGNGQAVNANATAYFELFPAPAATEMSPAR